MIAICDEEILGKSLKHNGATIVVQERFYGKDTYEEDEVLMELKAFTQLNVIGEKITNLLIKNRIVHPASVLWIEHDGIKIGHVMVF